MRNHSVDFFRGIAILIMVAANSYPYIFPDLPCPMLIRVLFSTAVASGCLLLQLQVH
jgi:hypothetical protein